MQQGDAMLAATTNITSPILNPLTNLSTYKKGKAVQHCDNTLDALSSVIDIIDHAPLVA